MDIEKMKEVLADEAFVKQLLAQEEPEQVQLMLEEKDISISINAIEQISAMLTKMQNGELTDEELDAIRSGTLTEEQLETVAGGSIIAIISMLTLFVGMIAGVIYISARSRW